MNISLLIYLMILMGFLLVAVLLIKYAAGRQATYNIPISNRAALVPREDNSSHAQIGNKLYQEYRYQEALTHYLAAVKENSKDKALHYRIGRIYQSMGDNGKAELAYKNVIAIDPNAADALLELCKLYFKQSKLSLASKYASQLLTTEPGNLEGAKLHARILTELGDWRGAESALKTLLETHPENTEIQFLLARALHKGEQWPEALEIYHKLLAKDHSDRKNIKYAIYQIYDKQGNYAQAVAMLKDIIESSSGTIHQDQVKTELAKCFCRQAQEAARQNQVQEAINLYHQAIGTDPNYTESYRGLGQLHASQKQYDTAIEYYQKAMEIGPENPQLYVTIATMYEQMDEFDEAIAIMQKAEKITPTARVYYYLGTLYGLKGDYDGCIVYLNRAMAKDPKFVDAYYNMAVAYEAQKRFKEALEMYKRVLELDKNHAEAKANYKHLRGRLPKR